MPAIKLTKAAIQQLAPRLETYVAYDALLPGFGCRITQAGTKSWIVEYRPIGSSRRAGKKRVTIGPTAALTPDQARKAAKEILARARLGEDVASVRAARRKALTVAELSERYMTEEVRPTRKPGTASLYEVHLRCHINPELGTRSVRDVTRGDIAKLHRKIGSGAPVTANRVVTLLSGMFTWAMRVGELPEATNPSFGLY